MHGAHVGGNDNAIPHYGDECIHKGSASEGEDKYQTLNELNRRGGGVGLTTACAAGGLGAAMIVETA